MSLDRMWVEVVEFDSGSPTLLLKVTLDKGEVVFPLNHAQAFALTTSLVAALEQL